MRSDMALEQPAIFNISCGLSAEAIGRALARVWHVNSITLRLLQSAEEAARHAKCLGRSIVDVDELLGQRLVDMHGDDRSMEG